MSRTVIACTLAAATTLTTSVASQGSDGPVLATPGYVFVDSSTQDSAGTPLGSSETVGKKAGFYPARRIGVPPPGVPRRPSFRPEDLFGTAIDPALEIDATSIGLDVIAANGMGRVQIGPGGWNAIVFSVGRGTVGTPGSRVATEAARPEGAAADMFSYTLPGSNLPPSVVGEVHRALSGPEIGLSGTTSTRTPGDIEALDLYAPLFELDANIRVRLPGSVANPLFFYFSVSNASITAGAVPVAWWNGATPSGATVLAARFTGIQWSQPRPFLEYFELGLDVSDDIDALAYDGNCKMLFSLVGVPRANQLKSANLCALAGATVQDYELTNGDKVSDQTGIDEGEEIGAICTVDPTNPANDSRRYWSGSLVNLGFPFPYTLDGAIYRSHVGPRPALTAVMSGWPVGGPAPGRAWFLISIDNGATWHCVTDNSGRCSWRRDATDANGDPQQWELSLPWNGALRGIRVLGMWVGADAGSADLVLSYAAQIFL